MTTPGSAAASLIALLPNGIFRGVQTALDPAGVQAERIAWLWWVNFAIAVGVYVLVVGALVFALIRGRVRTAHPGEDGPERGKFITVAIATFVTIGILFGLLVASVSAGHAIASKRREPAVVIELTGRQWWWEVNYPDRDPSRSVSTANEIHLPVGQLVTIRLASTDVIHSFWVPNLSGKMDLIPGHINVLPLRADRAGVYRGQCAEFCGLQHAHMALTVVAEPPDRFARWMEVSRASSVAPVTPDEKRGQQVFMSSPCPMCHTIRGIDAFGRNGPELTHIASRSTLGAGTLPNNRGNLAGWILDPQSSKPGTTMPPMSLDPPDLQALLAYLGSLK